MKLPGVDAVDLAGQRREIATLKAFRARSIGSVGRPEPLSIMALWRHQGKQMKFASCWLRCTAGLLKGLKRAI
jgi:hypothetical protein